MARIPGYRRLLITVALLALLLGGCAASPPASTSDPVASIETTSLPTASLVRPTASPVALVQPTLDRLAELLQASEAASLEADLALLVDPGSPVLRRVLADYLRATALVLPPDGDQVGYELLDTTPRGSGLLEATIRRSWDGRLHHWLFREHQGSWVVTQPSREERGETRSTTVGPLTLYFTAWDADLAETLTPLLERGVAQVAAALDTADFSEPVSVTLRAAIGTGETATSGYYDPGPTSARDQIVLYTSGYAFGSTDPSERWPESIAKVFTHELTHRVTDRAVMPLDTMPTWMSEGLAEHVAGNDHIVVPQFRAAALRGELLSVRELVQPAATTSRGMLYGCAQSATSYLIEQYGLDQFWQLATAYRDAAGASEQRMEAALQATFGLSSDQFDRAWRSWLIDRVQRFEAHEPSEEAL